MKCHLLVSNIQPNIGKRVAFWRPADLDRLEPRLFRDCQVRPWPIGQSFPRDSSSCMKMHSLNRSSSTKSFLCSLLDLKDEFVSSKVREELRECDEQLKRSTLAGARVLCRLVYSNWQSSSLPVHTNCTTRLDIFKDFTTSAHCPIPSEVLINVYCSPILGCKFCSNHSDALNLLHVLFL